MKAFSAVIIAFGILLFAASPARAAKSERPNVIIIMSDDQGGWDYGFMGNKVIHTPNLDAMVSRGALMTRFYVSPVCTPTRANLMTGRYNYRTRAIDTYIGRAMMEPDEVTIAEVMGASGYATGIFGKWHLGDSYPMRPQDQGFDEVLVIRGGGIGQPSDPPGGEGKYTDPILFHNGEQVQMKGYCTDIYFKAAMDFIGKNHQKGKPTFMYIPTNPPHGPYDDVPEELRKKYAALDVGGTLANPMAAKRNPKVRDQTERVCAMIENIDQNVGRLFEHLKKIGAYENTLVFFLNDNGPNGQRFVGPHRGSKGQIAEGGIRSPLIAHWPGKIPAGLKSSAIAAHYDVFPTVLEAARVKKPDDLRLDGISILGPLTSKVKWADRSIFLQWHRGDHPVPYRNGAVITTRYKLSWPNYGGEFAPKKHGPELYDLVSDPGEKNNLVETKPDIYRQLKRRYDVWFADVSATRPDNFEPPRIHIGNPKERTTVLTRQDWRYSDYGNGWARNAQGHWLVTVEQAGDYEVKVLFSPETKPGDLTVKFGRRMVAADPGPNVGEHRFEKVRFNAGPQRIDARLQYGELIKGVHQIYITKLR